MDNHKLIQDLQALQERVTAWKYSNGFHATTPRLMEAGEELDVALEELQAAEEELRRQNRALELAREAAEAERERYYDLFQFAPDGYLVTDLDGTVREANGAAARLLGVADRFLVGKPLVVFVEPADRRAFRSELMQRLGEANRVDELRLRLRRRGGAAFPAALTVAVTNEQSGPSGLLWLMRDVSQRTRVEELTDADRRKDEFLALAAHELRNPLAPLTVALELLRRGGADPRVLDTADHQVQKLSRLIEELLDVSRIRQGKMDFRPERVALDAVTAAAVETVRPLIDERRHTLEVALPAPSVYLEADPVRLEQVLTNLLTNAAKYTEPGGRISLRAERDGWRLVIRVQDNGVGLAAALLPRLFEPFVQSELNGRRSRGGLGLGLSLVKRFVEGHGGSVEARSDGPGCGSEFIVRLPALPCGGAAAPERPAVVLIVEDNRDAADSMAQLVRLWGFRAITAYDGASALAAGRQDPPDVALIDLALPDMEGCDVLRRLRDGLGLAPLAVAVTGFAADDRARLLEAGFERCLVKPVDPKELRSLLAWAPTRPPRPQGGV